MFVSFQVKRILGAVNGPRPDNFLLDKNAASSKVSAPSRNRSIRVADNFIALAILATPMARISTGPVNWLQ